MENGGEVYCGCEVGGGAGCCGPVALRFLGGELGASSVHMSRCSQVKMPTMIYLKESLADDHHFFLFGK